MSPKSRPLPMHKCGALNMQGTTLGLNSLRIAAVKHLTVRLCKRARMCTSCGFVKMPLLVNRRLSRRYVAEMLIMMTCFTHHNTPDSYAAVRKEVSVVWVSVLFVLDPSLLVFVASPTVTRLLTRTLTIIRYSTLINFTIASHASFFYFMLVDISLLWIQCR